MKKIALMLILVFVCISMALAAAAVKPITIKIAAVGTGEITSFVTSECFVGYTSAAANSLIFLTIATPNSLSSGIKVNRIDPGSGFYVGTMNGFPPPDNNIPFNYMVINP